MKNCPYSYQLRDKSYWCFYAIITKNIGIKPVEGQLVSGLTGIKILRQGRKNDRP